MIHSPTKAENKVMVAIKEVNENELPENGKTPSVCLHVSSVIHSVSNCHFPSVYLFMFIEGFLFNAATCAASQSPSNFQAGSEPRVKRDGRPALVKQKHSIQVTSISHTYFRQIHVKQKF